jgi:hypothetical protein
MSQIFPRSANALARASLAGVLTLVAVGGWVVFTLMRSSWVTKQHEFVEQPIQFSHAHHAGGMGLDCRYCHTSVEKSSFAGIPPTKTCMNCHSQIWTNAPILEPVRAPLLMEWCLECHRAPEKFIRPRDQVFNMAYRAASGNTPVEYGGQTYTDQIALGTRLKTEYNISGREHMTSCSVCHR